MKKSSPLVSRLLFYAGILAFCCLAFSAGGKEANEPPEPWTNSLGMKFVPVPGTAVLFSIWDTRVQDYEAFVKATGRSWKKPDFEQGPTHPAVNVSWDDAKAFCTWLTVKERSTGMLKLDQEYRLPMDLEWSTAMGLEKETGSTPSKRDKKIKGFYMWGTQWPPPDDAGNYDPSWKIDDFKHTSPVGSFAATPFGLYDMGGNVFQWCEDFFDNQNRDHVLRGCAFEGKGADRLRSSNRICARNQRNFSESFSGFRCVLASDSGSASQAQSDTNVPIALPTPTPKSEVAKEPIASVPSDKTEKSALKTLSLQAPNATAWALAPLDQSVPEDIRQHLTYLREDLLDEGKAAPKASADTYKLGSLLCDNLIAALDERDQALAGAGYRAAQADANTKVTSQSLEARRNYMMSWPQYSREKDERSEIQRQQMNNTVLVKESVKTAWFNRAAALRKSLDALYAKYRDALRHGAK